MTEQHRRTARRADPVRPGTTLRTRHARGLTELMTSRSDLRGVHDLADFVDEGVRWSV